MLAVQLKAKTKISARKEVIEQNRVRVGFERSLRKSLMKVWEDISDDLEKEYIRRQVVTRSLDGMEDRFRRVLEPHYREVILAFARRVDRTVKAEPELEFLIAAYLEAVGAERIVSITATTRARVLRTILRLESEQLGVDAIAAVLKDDVSGAFSALRAATIARTETHNAASYASFERAKQLDIPEMQKQWVSVNDPRTRSHHQVMNGVRVGMEEDFLVPYEGQNWTMSRPGDPRGGPANVINCRCALIFVTPDIEAVDS